MLYKFKILLVLFFIDQYESLLMFYFYIDVNVSEMMVLCVDECTVMLCKRLEMFCSLNRWTVYKYIAVLSYALWRMAVESR